MENDNTLNIDTSYDSVGETEAVVDSEGIVSYVQESIETYTPFEVIKKHAEMLGQDIQDPNPSCKECYGRGYIGRDSATKAPIPCRCIHTDYTNAQNQQMSRRMQGMSRQERRAQERRYKKMLGKVRR